MKKLLGFYKANDSVSAMSRSLEIVFDFAIIACAGLILTGFIVNNEKTHWGQMIFMLLNASVLSTHWFAHMVFKQRYEKKRTYFRVNTMAHVVALGLMGVGISLLAFERSGYEPTEKYKDLAYLEERAFYLWLAGYLASRLIVASNFYLAWRANRGNKALEQLTKWKAFSRMFIVALAIVHVILTVLFQNDRWLFMYIFVPIYLFCEFFGNYLGVNDKNLAHASDISFEYMKERYSKIIILYISAMFVSGTVQFAFYLKHVGDDYMIPRFIMTYVIAFMLWWLHSDRMHRFSLKTKTKNLHLLSLITLIISPALAMFGGMLINANTDKYVDFIVPAMFFTFALILLMYIFVIRAFENKTEKETLTRETKFMFIYQLIPFITIAIVMGVLSLFIPFTIWVLYGVITFSLVALAALSRWTIHHKIKSCE